MSIETKEQTVAGAKAFWKPHGRPVTARIPGRSAGTHLPSQSGGLPRTCPESSPRYVMALLQLTAFVKKRLSCVDVQPKFG